MTVITAQPSLAIENCRILVTDEKGRPIADGGDRFCVFVPNSPNPITGRLYFTSMKRCHFLPVSSKEALKTVVSSGNYLPAAFGVRIPPASM